MQRNTAFLLDQVKTAITASKGGIAFSASDASELWGVTTQVIEGQATGKIVVGCVDDTALDELRTELRRLGHQVEDGWSLSTSDPVPNTILVTPAG